MSTVERAKSLLADLGRPTLRGVRKCPKCGTFNGTRGISCKNKACGVVFKERSPRKKLGSAEAIKIITGSENQLYSVRVRDRGPDYRGFVQLPLLPVQEAGAEANIEESVARCFVDSCVKPLQPTATLIGSNCQHVKATLRCSAEAQPLALKNSVLNSLQVSNEVKQSIWLLATESPGPLVQRVTKHVMVVKCKVNPRHPLGFLHFAFFQTSKNKESPEHRFSCSCRAFKNNRDEKSKCCIHFFACICAFASGDEKLIKEFSYYIHLDATVGSPEGRLSTVIPENEQLHSDCKVELVVVPVDPSSGNAISKKRKNNTDSMPVDEAKVSISFYQWLASITERINQTMHYQFDGNPDPLVFHVPQVFFECFQQRIATGSKKKRLPNSTTAFIRKDALPLGMFSKYTWHITNILHVKQIFDTEELRLDITRSFVENRDGTYDLYETSRGSLSNGSGARRKVDCQPSIRPFELKTFLKVGNTSPEQKEPTPFVIEWIPNILPKLKIGELRIKFEYGHQRNGQIEYRQSPSPNPSGIVA